MPRKRIAVLAAVLALVLAATAAVAAALTPWTDTVTGWHYVADGAHTDMVMIRQIGTKDDTQDDTHPVTFTDMTGTVQHEHASPYITLDLSGQIPTDAKVVQLSVKTLITKTGPQNALDDVFVFIRKPGSLCCQGPVNSPDTPVDFSVSTNPDHLGEAAQSVLETGPGGIRDFVPVTVPVVDGQVQVAWGYQMQPGDALGFDIYLDGYGT